MAVEVHETRTGRRSLREWLGLSPRRATRPGQVSRRGIRPPAPEEPWWARLFVNGGRPMAAVVVMVMCAPGEHHLAVLSGWDDKLAWGMPMLLAGYAGMAAYLAGQREKGERGYRTATVGAVLALVLATAAQPVSHAFVTGWLTAEPRVPLWLMVVVSSIPAPVLGHIFHLAATQKRRPVPTQAQPVPPRALLATKDVAELLGITPSGVNTRVSRGKLIPAMKDPDVGNLFDPSTMFPAETAEEEPVQEQLQL